MTLLRTLCLVAFSAFAGSCNQPSTSKPLPASNAPVTATPAKPLKGVYSVEDLLANPQNFRHTMVKVRGCFWSDVGSVTDNAESLLMQCGTAWPTPNNAYDQKPYQDFYDHVISVDNAECYQMNRSELDARGPYELEALKGLPIKQLLFACDEKRNSQAWHRLLKGRNLNDSLRDYGSEVVLLGQFETGLPQVAPISNGLILVDVLSTKATTTR